MAIFVDQNLAASPNPTDLPKRIEFTQTLRSSLPSEAITCQYSLAAAHNIWFDDGNGNLSKQIVRQDTIGSTPQVAVDRITLTTGPGMSGLLTVEVAQSLRDSEGNVTPGLVIVQIQS